MKNKDSEVYLPLEIRKSSRKKGFGIFAKV